MRRVVAICVIAASAFIGSPVRADLHVLDQSQEQWNYSDGVGSPTLMAQTFTAGMDGTLCDIQIGNTSGILWGDYLGAPARPVVEIRNVVSVTNGEVVEYQPGSTTLGSVSLTYVMPYKVDGAWLTTNSSEPDWTPLIPFSISVTRGEMYAIVLGVAEGQSGGVSVSGTTDDSYTNGALWKYVFDDEIGKDIWAPDYPVSDMQFRTYVVPVPLPAGVFLGILGLSVAGWRLKRQLA